MNNLQKIIVKNLISNCQNNFMFYIRDVKHGDPESINNFCEVVKKEMKEKENVDIEVKGVRSMWYNMRRKFVKINLEKVRRQKISDTHEEFYQYLIFLENYISHKEDSVYISLNQKEVQQRVYDYLMGHTYDEQHENIPEQPYEKPHEEQHKEPHEEPKEDDMDNFLKNYPDLKNLFNINDQNADIPQEVSTADSAFHLQEEYNQSMEETSGLEILEGYEDIVMISLLSNNESKIQIEPFEQLSSEEPSIIKKAFDSQTTEFEVDVPVNNVSDDKSSVYYSPLQSCIDTVDANEKQLSSIRLKNDKLNLKIKSALVKEAVIIIYSALMESRSKSLKKGVYFL